MTKLNVKVEYKTQLFRVLVEESTKQDIGREEQHSVCRYNQKVKLEGLWEEVRSLLM